MGEITAGVVSSKKALGSLSILERSKGVEEEQVRRRKQHSQRHGDESRWVFSRDRD